MFCHQFQGEAGSDGGRTGAQGDRVQFADERNMSHGIFEVPRTKIKVVHGKRLLEDGWIRTLRHRHQYGIGVAHVMAADYV